MSENDAEFVEDMMGQGDWAVGSRMHRLAILARRGADAADRIEQLEEANELMLTDIRRTDVDMLAFKARIEKLEAALRPLACTCKAKHQAGCSRSEVDCPFWNARAALEERT